MPKHVFPAAAEGMPNFNRRTILGGMVALPAGCLPAHAGERRHGIPLLALFHEWREAYDASTCEADAGPLTLHHWALLDQARVTPAVTVQDFAAKLLMLTVHGEFALEDENLVALLADADSAGYFPMPSSLAAFRAGAAS